MDSFELNKILGAVLGTCTVLVAVNIATDAIFAPKEPAKPGYEIAVEEPTTTEAKVAEPAEQEPIETRLAKASVEQGENAARKCAACHTFEKGGPNRVGPNLWGVVGRPRASEEGFNYSAALKAKGGKWTFEELDKFLTDPRGYIAGTTMTFAGIRRARERADLINYLRTLADNPVPLPKTVEAPRNSQSDGSGSKPKAN